MRGWVWSFLVLFGCGVPETGRDPSAAGAAPTAHCVSPIIATEDTDEVIILDATDPDGGPLTLRITRQGIRGTFFQYTNGVGAEITVFPTLISDPQGRIVFRPPPNQYGTYITWLAFEAVDADGNRSAETSCRIDITGVNDPPTVDLGADQTATLGDTVTLSAQVRDVESDPLTLDWRQLTTEPITYLSPLDQESLSFRPERAGVVEMELRASDGALTGSDTIRIRVEEPPVACEPTVLVLDFESDSDGHPLPAGTVAADQWDGVSVSCQNNHGSHPDLCVVFDSSSPTGGDDDLGTPHRDFGGPGRGAGGAAGGSGENAEALGNLLIVGENDGDHNADGLVDTPDDEARGGQMTFTFDGPRTVDSILLVDIDQNENGGALVMCKTDGGLVGFSVPALGDNSVQSLAVDTADVLELSIDLISSGAVGEIVLVEECPECVAADCSDGIGCTVDECLPEGGCANIPDDSFCGLNALCLDLAAGSPGCLCDVGFSDCDASLGCETVGPCPP